MLEKVPLILVIIQLIAMTILVIIQLIAISTWIYSGGLTDALSAIKEEYKSKKKKGVE